MKPDFRSAEAWGEEIRDIVKTERRKARIARREARDAALAQVRHDFVSFSARIFPIVGEKKCFGRLARLWYIVTDVYN